MNRKKIFWLVGIVLILVFIATGAFFQIQKIGEEKEHEKAVQATQQAEKEAQELQAKEQAELAAQQSRTGEEIAKDYYLRPGESVSLESVKNENLPENIFSDVKWHQPVSTTNLGIFTERSSNCTQKQIADNGGLYPDCSEFIDANQTYFSIANFEFNNIPGEIFTTAYYPIAYNSNLNEYIIVKYNGKTYLLSKNSADLTAEDGINKNKILVDKTTVLSTSNPEKMIDVPGKEKLSFMEKGKISEFTNEYLNKTALNVGEYKGSTIYDYKDYFVMFTENIVGINPLKYNISLPKYFTIAGKKISANKYYSDHLVKCGGRGGVDVVREADGYTENTIVKIGTTDDDRDLFKPKDIGDGSETSEMFKNYNGYGNNLNQATTSLETYLASNPILIMKDGFGRLIRFTSKEYYIQMAECGKPVIYLYPKTNTQVNVQVKPNGGLTKVDPLYPANGWMVNAKPNGDLTNTDGQNYPYLFWEGKAYNMKVPTDGFVLKKANVKSEMQKLLAREGLNAKETTDFLDFWQTKLEEKPYVFVTFVSQAEFDRVAPMKVSPAPDKTIRVFMEYQPLDFPVGVRPLKIETPIRNGFTVVEWGGRLHE